MFADVAIQKLAIDEGTLTYEIPSSLQVQPGMLVQVPYKALQLPGIVVRLRDTSPYATTKPLTQILEAEPLLTSFQLHVAAEVAHYYLAPVNRVLQLFLPKQLWEHTWTPKLQTTYDIRQPDYIPAANASKEQRILELFHGRTSMTPADLENAGLKPGDLKTLIQKKILERSTGALLPTLPYTAPHSPLSQLSPKQEELFQQMLKQPACYLLHGITGSGKTEIYIHLVDHFHKQGKQSIILVPEIALTSQVIAKFQRHFGEEVALLHSHLNDRERAQEWMRIRSKDAKVIIGSRSALFAPVQDYGAIIIDEEHDWSYKNDQTPRYHATSVAHILQRLSKCTLLLGSATPSVESYYHAEQGTYLLLELLEKYY